MGVTTTSARSPEIHTRPVNTSEIDSVLEFFEKHAETSRATEGFRWKYLHHSRSETIPIQIALRDDTIVGAVGFIPLTLEGRSGTIKAVKLGDIALLPDEEMTTRDTLINQGLGECIPEQTTIAFECGSETEWERVGPIPYYFRLHRLSAVHHRRWTQVFDPVVRFCTGKVSALRVRLAHVRQILTPAPTDIVRTSGVPVELLTSFSTQSAGRLHIARTEGYYRWRFSKPNAQFFSYVVFQHGTPVAACVIERTKRSNRTVASIVEIYARDHVLESTISGILGTVTAEHGDADYLLAPAHRIPEGIMQGHGFLPCHRLPLSLITPQRELRLTPLTNGALFDAGSLLLDPDAWSLDLQLE